MARRRGSKRQQRERGRDYYEGLPTDAEYKRTAHRRVMHQSIKSWIVRIGVLAVLGLLVWVLHDDVARYLRVHVFQKGEEYRGTRQHIEEGRDRRAGVDWVEGE